jgi:NitT/TauT family transport system substrate-binding protein
MMKSLTLAAIAATLLAVTSALSAAAQSPIWREGTIAAKGDAGFIMMAARRGFAEAQDLKLDMVEFTGDSLLTKALLAGDLDSYDANPGGAIIAAAHGADIKLLGCYWQVLTYAIFAKPAIASPADLKGKSFAISGPGSLPDLLARVLLEQNGLTADEVSFAVMGSDTDRFKALSAGIVDLAAASSEFTPLAAQQGIKLFAHAHDFAPNYMRMCTVTTSKVVAARHADAVRFMASEMTALSYALAHRDDEIALTREVTGAKADDPRPGFIFDEIAHYQAIDPTMPLPKDKLDWLQSLLVKTGNLAQLFDTAKIIDGSLRTEALARAGK